MLVAQLCVLRTSARNQATIHKGCAPGVRTQGALRGGGGGEGLEFRWEGLSSNAAWLFGRGVESC